MLSLARDGNMSSCFLLGVLFSSTIRRIVRAIVLTWASASALVKIFRQVGYNKTIGPIHTKFGMGIHLGERNSYADFGGGTFKVKVTRALCY